MIHAIEAIAHENKVRRRQSFTPPQSTAHAADGGLALHWRAYRYRVENIGSELARIPGPVNTSLSHFAHGTEFAGHST